MSLKVRGVYVSGEKKTFERITLGAELRDQRQAVGMSGVLLAPLDGPQAGVGSRCEPSINDLVPYLAGMGATRS
jgi:hypothetical protein